jgi:NADH:ubiquinone oxidoreductase subunit 2 (subunit N)
MTVELSRRGAMSPELLILVVFGVLWWIGGAVAVRDRQVATAVIVAGLVLAVAVVAAGWQRRHHGQRRRMTEHAWRWDLVINVIQLVAIVVAVRAADRAGAGDSASALIAIIVGVHFLPLARLFFRPVYLLTGLLMIATGAAGIAAAHGTTVRIGIGLTCAAILWFSAIWRMRGSSAGSGRRSP